MSDGSVSEGAVVSTTLIVNVPLDVLPALTTQRGHPAHGGERFAERIERMYDGVTFTLVGARSAGSLPVVAT